MKRVKLPSGKSVAILAAGKPQRTDVLFADALALEIEPGSVRNLALADFHVVRAIATKRGWIPEESITVDCMNCNAPIEVKPCANLEVAPWEDGEVADPELDQVIMDGRFSPRTVRETLPLFKALARPHFDVSHEVVEAMGIREMTANFLTNCDDETFDGVTDAWLDMHYVPRLAAEVACSKCGARNTVDAPYDREFDRGADAGAGGHSSLPALADFVELAHAIAEPLLNDMPGDPPELIVEDGTPAVDDGGVPLLGSYVPPPPRDAPVPTGLGTVTIYYQTFEAMMRDEPSWDWEDELRETIEHELDHHLYFLRGHDPMDEEEHAEIARDGVRVVGRKETARRELADVVRRLWPIFLLAAVVLVITIAESRCAP